MFEWDDMRVFLAAARAPSLSSAAQRLHLDTATVGRRIGRLETALGSTLFVRSPRGLSLTAAGARLAEIASTAETAMDAAQRLGREDTLAGTVRISAAEGFGSQILAPALPRLTASRPGLRIELAAQSGFLSPSRREADMAITLSAPESARLIVEPLTGYQLALYASPGFLATHAPLEAVEDLRQVPTVGYVPDLLYAPELRYLDEICPGLVPDISSSSILAQRAVIEADGGVGVLPCFLADGLTRILPQVLIERRFWLSTHVDAHGAARLRAVRGWLVQLLASLATRLTPFS